MIMKIRSLILRKEHGSRILVNKILGITFILQRVLKW